MSAGADFLLSVCVALLGSSVALSVRQANSTGGNAPAYLFFASMATVELIKLVLATMLEAGTNARPDLYLRPWNAWMGFRTSLPYAVPAFLYAVDNNLMFVVLRLIDPATFQLLNNSKILITAVLFRVVLKRHVSARQWGFLCLLVGGVVLSQQHQMTGGHVLSANHAAHFKHQHDASFEESKLLGLALVLVMAVNSSFANVFTEYMFKEHGGDAGKGDDVSPSLHVQNMHLYCYGVAINVCLLFAFDGHRVFTEGPFTGWTVWNILIVFVSSFTGLGVAFLLKYADNMVYVFAQCLSTFVTAMASMALFHQSFSRLFFMGAGLVAASVYGYHVSGAGEDDDAAVRALADVTSDGWQDQLEQGGQDAEDSGEENLDGTVDRIRNTLAG